MKLIDQSIRNYHTVTVIIVMALVLGTLCFRVLPQQLTPTVDKPQIEVRTEYIGLSPNEVERNITRRLEDQLESVEGMKKMTSTSQHGLSTINLEFEWGIDKDLAVLDVNNKLQQVKDLPVNADKPTLRSISSDNSSPIMWIVLTSPMKKCPT